MNPTTASAKVLALHIGRALHIESTSTGEWWDKPWDTGFYKQPQTGPCWLGYEGFRSDEQADRRYHGGSEKAVCVYPAEHYPYWREALEYPDLPHGAFGENLTIEGLPETEICIGDRFSLGEAVVQVSQPRQPCWKLARRWQVKDLPLQVERTGFTGYYFRVLHHGHVRPGDTLELTQRPFFEWTIARCNEVMHHGKGGPGAARALAECPLLSSSWKDGLWMRAEKMAAGSPGKRREQPG
ncbi:MOSC domain-containing protein [Haloferula sp. BvORR071]|uniref:MOSC domain-containing protein n=1 Tax=Haloferula sp. BvORR071 TaxID=1396141 RepID=UPI000695EABE|nr:MOSC domain-containing protein [Haloferula sp. BvORR071]